MPSTSGPKTWCGTSLWKGGKSSRPHLPASRARRRGTSSSSTASSPPKEAQHCKSWHVLPTDRAVSIIPCFCSNSSRFLRNKDRDDNKDNYPALHWPEVYLLHGGYKAFYEQFDECCQPRGYMPMNQQGREEELRRCRAKTKSCNGDGKSGRPLTKSTSRRLELL